jgi:hypothetical protein
MLLIVEVHFTHEQEVQLARLAANAGIDAERLVKDAALRLREADPSLRGVSPPALAKPELPLWHLGGAGPLHRRDIYDDAR